MKKYIVTLLVVSSFAGLRAQTDSVSFKIQSRLDSLMHDPLLERTQLGLMVYDLTADSALYRHGEKQTLRPASTMKLLTAITAIDLLGGSYPFRTSLQYEGAVTDSILSGNLYCVGGMDPMFDDTNMNTFVQSLRAIGVKTIRGSLVAVRNFKEPDLLGEGWCWDDDNPQLSPLLVSRNDEFMQVFASRLREAGIMLESPITTGSLPSETLTLCAVSHTLQDVLVPMMKESDNLYAESMFFQIAASQGGRPAKAVHARQLVKKELSKAGVTNIQYRIADGSGLSLYNYITPELMVKLLTYAYRHPSIYSHLAPSLPISGQDGTLKKRMTDPVTNGRVKAKTGTVTGVSSLAGYVTAANNHLLAFCIINQGVMKSADGRAFQDSVCTALCER